MMTRIRRQPGNTGDVITSSGSLWSLAEVKAFLCTATMKRKFSVCSCRQTINRNLRASSEKTGDSWWQPPVNILIAGISDLYSNPTPTPKLVKHVSVLVTFEVCVLAVLRVINNYCSPFFKTKSRLPPVFLRDSSKNNAGRAAIWAKGCGFDKRCWFSKAWQLNTPMFSKGPALEACNLTTLIVGCCTEKV